MTDHYVVLPSNSCPNVHPDNKAGKFHVSWQNPLEFHGGDWRVALVEMNYDYSPKTTNPLFGIEYGKITFRNITIGPYSFIWNEKRQLRLEGDDGLAGYVPVNPPYDSFTIPTFKVDDGGHIYAESSFFRFNISFAGQRDAKKAGFDSTIARSYWDRDRMVHVLKALRPLPEEEKESRIDHIVIDLTSLPYTVKHTAMITQYEYCSNAKELVESLKILFEDVFSLLKMSSNYHLVIQMREDVTHIRLLGGFNIVLGFDDTYLTNSTPQKHLIHAQHPPQLRRGYTRMYIYASCCAEILVGDVRVPLLRSVFVEDDPSEPEDTFAKTKNIVIDHPMYVPLSGTTINTIEVNIRDDAGRIIPFDEGTVSSLTLHFRQQQQQNHD